MSKSAFLLFVRGKTPAHWITLFLFAFLCLENYRLQSAYENNLIIKMVFVSHYFPSFGDKNSLPWMSEWAFAFLQCFLLVLQFEFINSYLSLFYIGFYLKDMERLKEVTTVLFIKSHFIFKCPNVTLLNTGHRGPK